MTGTRSRTPNMRLLGLVFLGTLVACGPGNGMFEQDDPNAVPTTPPTLYQYLEAGSYKGFDHESAYHASAGPHQVLVQAYLNPALVQSLTAGNPQHPVGSAAVKELYDANGALIGWAVMVKQRDDITDGTAWFWYETQRGPTRADDPNYAGDGRGVCIECHGEGKGFIRIPFPLR